MGNKQGLQKVILIAAGMGNRLKPMTDDRPKCLLEVGGQTLLARAIGIFRAAGLGDLAIVRGHCAELIQVDGARYFENPNYRHNNILHSLFSAEEFMTGGFVASYSDILFQPSVVQAVLSSEADIAVVSDRDWRTAYVGRTEHPLSEAEVLMDRQGRVEKIGKGVVSGDQATGEFIGMARFSAKGAEVLRGEFWRLREHYRGRDTICFQKANSFEKAYLTDMFQELVDRGVTVETVPIQGGWMEIDTAQDLQRAKSFVTGSGE